MQLGKLPFYH